MIYLIHRGWGGRYTNYVSQNVKNIGRMRRMELTAQEPINKGYRVAITPHGNPLTNDKMIAILQNPNVTFYIGDSKGLPDNILNQVDEVVSVSSLGIGHQLEAAIITTSIETVLLNNQTCRV